MVIKNYIILFFVSQLFFKVGILHSQSVSLDNLIEKMEHFKDNNLDSALVYSDRAISKAKKLNQQKKLAYLLKYKGILLKDKGLYRVAEQSLLQALAIYTSLADSLEMAKIYNNLSIVKKRQNQYAAAIKYTNQAIPFLYSKNEYILLGKAYNSLGNIYANMYNYSESKSYYTKALKIIKDKDAKLEMLIKGNIAEVLADQGAHQEGIDILEECEAKYITQGNIKELARIVNSIGVSYWDNNEIEKAIQHFEESIEYCKHIKNDLLLSDALINLGDIYLEKEDFNRANEYFLKANKIYNTGIGSIEDRQYLAESLANIHETNGNPTIAIQYLKESYALEASIDSIAGANKLIAEQAKLGFAEKDMTIKEEKIKTQEAELEAERHSANVSKILIFAIIGGFTFFYYYKKEQRQRILQEKEHKAKIDDALSVAKLKGEKLGRKRISAELHDNISTILVAVKRDLELTLLKFSKGKDIVPVLNKTIVIADKAYNRVRDLSHALDPSPVDWLDDLDIHIRLLEENEQFQVEKSIDIDQPIPVEIGGEISKIAGVLLHNVEKHSKATEVFIELTSFDEGVNLMVVDNGIGFNRADVNNKKGIGIKNIEQRVKQLNGTCRIDNRLGTTITIDIPLNTNRSSSF